MKNFIKKHFVLILALIYLIWPLDIIPDVFISLLGPIVGLDDSAFIIFALIKEISNLYKTKDKNYSSKS